MTYQVTINYNGPRIVFRDGLTLEGAQEWARSNSVRYYNPIIEPDTTTQALVKRAEREAAEAFAALKRTPDYDPETLIDHIDRGGIVDMVTTPSDLRGEDLDGYFDTAAQALANLLAYGELEVPKGYRLLRVA